MNERQRLILNYILFSYENHKNLYDFLSLATGSSERTIRRDIIDIENEISCPINVYDFSQIRNKKDQIIENLSQDSMTNLERVFLSLFNHLINNKKTDLSAEAKEFLKKWSDHPELSLLECLKSIYLTFPFDINDISNNIFNVLHPRIQKLLTSLFNEIEIKTELNNLDDELGNLPRQQEYIFMLLENIFIKKYKIEQLDERFTKYFLHRPNISEESLFEYVNNVFEKWLGIKVNLKSEILKNLYNHICYYEKNKNLSNVENNDTILGLETNKKLVDAMTHFSEKNFNKKVDLLESVYFRLLFIEYINNQSLSFLIGCYGGQGTSVMIESFIRNQFPNSIRKITTINNVEKIINEENFDIVILTDEIKSKFDYIRVLPMQVLNDPYSIIKAISQHLQNKYEVRNEKNI